MEFEVERSRPEEEIFRDLEELTSSSGYAHVIAAICFRDNIVRFGEEMAAEDMLKMFSHDRLLRTEISTLIGLMVKSPLHLQLPEPASFQKMLSETDALMLELHHSMSAPMFESLRNSLGRKEPVPSSSQGEYLREPIFYGGESAYFFQYRDFSVLKYSGDNDWLEAHKGFCIEDAHAVITSIANLQNEKLISTLESMKEEPPEQWTMLPAFTFSVEEIVAKSELSAKKVADILSAFSLPPTESNSKFLSVSDFNVTNAFPLLPVAESTYLCFQSYSIAEALYESPFYWMIGDKSYSETATENRGEFTEEFCAKRLADVFGKKRVYQNVSICRGKNVIGEIDVLVVFANRIIIVQAKSKRLTIESRKGNDNQIKKDFKLGIQAAYDQGRSCAKLLQDDSVELFDSEKAIIEFRFEPKEIHIFCVISDHYPALAIQARQFLEISKDNDINPPFVMDLFTLDAIAEMLASPLYFLSYVNRRVGYSDRILASHELTILSYHLKHNLWLDGKYDMFQIQDDISSDLDVAMIARRDGVPGKRTPDGILTRMGASTVGKLIKQIEHREDPASIDLGFMLLTLSEDTINQLNDGIDYITKLSANDFSHHDFTLGFGSQETGLTVHSNFESDIQAMHHLSWHCEKRKYSQHAESWFGLCLRPGNGDIRFGIKLEYPWFQSEELDKAAAKLKKKNTKLSRKTDASPRRKKIGRNDPCPCGSGQKYKKCCLK